jgi:chromate reductase
MKGRTLRVLAIPGSLRKNSYNRSLLEAAADLTPPGMSIAVYDSLDTVPVFNEDWEHPTLPSVARLRQAVASSDGLLIATPEYNQSVPGVVKNMIDWLSRSQEGDGIEGKPVAVTGVTTGTWGTRIAQTYLRQMLISTHALVLPQPTLFFQEAARLFNEDRTLADQGAAERLHQLLVSFDGWIRPTQRAKTPELEGSLLRETPRRSSSSPHCLLT